MQEYGEQDGQQQHRRTARNRLGRSAQAWKGTVHEQHDDAVGEQQEEGEGKEDRLCGPGLAPDKAFARDSAGRRGIQRLEHCAARQGVERAEALFGTVEAGRVVETCDCGPLVWFQRAGAADLAGQHALGGQESIGWHCFTCLGGSHLPRSHATGTRQLYDAAQHLDEIA
ncbi:conserved hypothetical protein [Ricinus communis]|uniref:Uncharacterized protein n=1 Tax=Ricinus communis TaxID=3988 RepID=B9TQD8_RICCO|nr:conserved hypothetical protein [Ricinus communis]